MVILSLPRVFMLASGRDGQREIPVCETQPRDSRNCRATAPGCLIKEWQAGAPALQNSQRDASAVAAVADSGSSTATTAGSNTRRRMGFNKSAQKISQTIPRKIAAITSLK